MESVLIVLGFLAFIAWRERQHVLERASLPQRGGKARVRVPLPRRKPKAGRTRVISADDDAAFAASRGWEPSDDDELDQPAEEDED